LGGGGGGGRSSNSACSSASVTSGLSLSGTFMVGVEEDGFSPEPRETPVGLGVEILEKPGWNDLSVVVEIGLRGEVAEGLPVTGVEEKGIVREGGIGNPDDL
jgi:hypothetical protein